MDGDSVQRQMLRGTLTCVDNGWWEAAERALQVDGARVKAWRELGGSRVIRASIASIAFFMLCAKTPFELGDDGAAFAASVLKHPSVDLTIKKVSMIRQVTKNGHLKIVELLVADPRVDLGTNLNSAIRTAAKFGRADVVELLLTDPDVDPSDLFNSAICTSSENGYVAVVELLLADPRVDPGARENTAIREASNNGHDDVVALLAADPRVDTSVL